MIMVVASILMESIRAPDLKIYTVLWFWRIKFFTYITVMSSFQTYCINYNERALQVEYRLAKW